MNFDKMPQTVPAAEVPRNPIEERASFTPEEQNHIAQELLKITPEEVQMLQERIRNTQGHARIFVHPFYIHNSTSFFTTTKEGEIDTSESEKLEAIELLEEGFERTVRSVADNPESAPLIIFEEGGKIATTKKAIEAILDGNTKSLAENGIVFIPTEEGTGDTSYVETSALYQSLRPVEGDSKSILTHQQSDFILTGALAPFQIASTTMAGAYFRHSLVATDSLAACAGAIREKLKALQIKVDISRYSVTDRETLKHYGFKTKHTGKNNL